MKPASPDEPPQTQRTLWSVCRLPVIVSVWALASSQLILINKLFLHSVPSPSFALTCQSAFGAAAIYALKLLGVVEADNLEVKKAATFMPVVLTFVGTLGTNMLTLQYLNVETFICFRASMPLLLSVLEAIFIQRNLPGLASLGSMACILVGAAMYVYHDIHFNATGYGWLSVWYISAAYELLVTKHIMNTLHMTPFGRTLYQNFFAVPLFAAVMLFDGSLDILAGATWSPTTVAFLVASCVFGVALGLCSFLLRDSISATAFSVMGNLAKVATIAVNYVIWDNHATLSGIASLGVALAACATYRQAPMRQPGEPLSFTAWVHEIARQFSELSAGNIGGTLAVAAGLGLLFWFQVRYGGGKVTAVAGAAQPAAPAVVPQVSASATVTFSDPASASATATFSDPASASATMTFSDPASASATATFSDPASARFAPPSGSGTSAGSSGPPRAKASKHHRGSKAIGKGLLGGRDRIGAGFGGNKKAGSRKVARTTKA